jgi:CheY-like chemotaxis protein
MIVGDPGRLRQILLNLVGNAIKFTERGHILVAITEEDRSATATTLHVRVSDTGIGIPSDKLATVFEPFSQADGSTPRKFGGTGLGLTISSTLVSLMGGRIWVESEQGVGSTFHFTVNLGVTDLVARPAPHPLLRGLPSLIVDDNAVNRQILERQVIAWDMRPVMVDGGQRALEALSAAAASGQPFRIVLLDANMPDIDGFTVAGEIARRPELVGTTILMLSSSGLSGETSRCRELGIAVYLTKPLRATELLAAIGRALDAAPASAPKTVAERAASPAPAPPAVRARKILVAEDNAVNQRVARSLLSKRGHQVTVVDTGARAVEAVAAESFDLVLMDVQMPEMDGFEATAAIRAAEQGSSRHTRIIAMTAHALNGDAERCLRAGMDGYLSKPLNPRQLAAVVEENASGLDASADSQPAETVQS